MDRAPRAIAGAAIGITLIAGIGFWATSRMDGPLSLIPGGAFHGVESDCPEDWTQWAGLEELQLEIRPSVPRSMTIWSVVLDQTLYLPADFLTPLKFWPDQLQQDDRIRLRRGTGQAIYRCRAIRVTDIDTIARLREAIALEYDIDSDGWAANAEVWWFRVAAR